MDVGEDDDLRNGYTPPPLTDQVRRRLGLQLQAMYEPIIDEVLDPRLADLLGQLEAGREGGEAP